jgi:hypothetical protein
VNSDCETCKRGVSLSGDHENVISNVVVQGNYSRNREVGVLVSNSNNVFITNTTTIMNGLSAIVLQGEKGANNITIVNSDFDQEVKISNGSTDINIYGNNKELGSTLLQNDGISGLPQNQSLEEKNPPIGDRSRNKKARTLKSVIRSMIPVSLLNRLNLNKYSTIILDSNLFDNAWYLRTYPDVAKNRIDPIKHYILHGVEESRDPNATFHTREYLKKNPM